MGDALAQGVDEITVLVRVRGGERIDAARLRVAPAVEVQQSHGMNLDDVVDDELHPGETDAVARQPPPAQGRRRVGEVHHELRAGAAGCPPDRCPAPRNRRCHRRRSPASPSAQDTVTACPSAEAPVALPVPIIAGRPSSRLTMAACEVRPPWSVTMAAACFMIGTQSGSVCAVTSMSPSRKRPISSAVSSHADSAGRHRLADALAGGQAACPCAFRV